MLTDTESFELLRELKGHENSINRLAWSPDGKILASPSSDHKVRLWDKETGKLLHILIGHEGPVSSIAWHPEGTILASGSYDGKILLWNRQDGTLVSEPMQARYAVYSVAWSHNGRWLASGSWDSGVILWEWSENILAWCDTLRYHKQGVNSVIWSPHDSDTLVSGSKDSNILIWKIKLDGRKPTLERIGLLGGHGGGIATLAWSPDGDTLASGSEDRTIRIWNPKTLQNLRILEGHTAFIKAVSFSHDGKFLASKAHDDTVRFWDTSTWETVKIEEISGSSWQSSLAFHPEELIIATLGENDDTVIRILKLNKTSLSSSQAVTESVHYTTAKLVLVGDTGVGKTGLGWRLAHGYFKEHASTHGQQFWIIDNLATKRQDGTECEAVLWDLAGQHIYRRIHAIFLDDVDLALVLFEPTYRQDPLKGVGFWLEQLKGKKQLPPSVLVGARIDCGASVLSQQELDQFCQRYGISGGYIGTSAKTGDGLAELLEIIKAQLPWDRMTATVTTVTFKRIKKFVLELKEKQKLDRKGVLVSPSELRAQLDAKDSQWQFTDTEMITAVKNLENHGHVTILRSLSGEESILLTPELLVDLASSMVLQANNHPHDLGALSETALLQGSYIFPELVNLAPTEQQILLRAAVIRFVEHNICFRETLGTETLLIFPDLIKQKRPLFDEVETVEDVSYIVRGRVENVYAALVVLLGYTPTFTRINQWQNQAQYEMGKDQICGFRLIEERQGEIELVLYYSRTMPDYGRTMFQGLFEKFLYQRDVEVTPFPPVACPRGHRQERSFVVRCLREGEEFFYCPKCKEKIDLLGIGKPLVLKPKDDRWIQGDEALARLRSTYESYLVQVKSFRGDRAAPRCYISHTQEQEAAWAAGQLTHDLRDAGVFILEDKMQIQERDFVIVVGTPTYQQAWNRSAESIAADVSLIQKRFQQTTVQWSLIPLLLKGDLDTSVPCELHSLSKDFRDRTHYTVGLFDLVLTLYAIPFNHQVFAPLREGLERQWKETNLSYLKIFISYTHKDEKLKDELVTMLAGIERQGIIKIWHDRHIEEGDEWNQSIKNAMNECDMALLLISGNFIASRFIQEKELPGLLQRRQEQGLRVIPVIVDYCTWQSEPVLKDLQALPRDGKPVIGFSKSNGRRNKIWKEIVEAIETRAIKLAGELRKRV